jgi:hypothetical protein
MRSRTTSKSWSAVGWSSLSNTASRMTRRCTVNGSPLPRQRASKWRNLSVRSRSCTGILSENLYHPIRSVNSPKPALSQMKASPETLPTGGSTDGGTRFPGCRASTHGLHGRDVRPPRLHEMSGQTAGLARRERIRRAPSRGIPMRTCQPRDAFVPLRVLGGKSSRMNSPQRTGRVPEKTPTIKHRPASGERQAPSFRGVDVAASRRTGPQGIGQEASCKRWKGALPTRGLVARLARVGYTFWLGSATLTRNQRIYQPDAESEGFAATCALACASRLA